MVVKCSVLALSAAAGLLLAQHGNGGGEHHGGGGMHSPAVQSAPMGGRSGGGYPIAVTPQSYGGQLTFSVPMGSATLGAYRSNGMHSVVNNGLTSSHPTWTRPPIRRPEQGERRDHRGGGGYPIFGYYGYGFDPYYYNNSVLAEPVYQQQQEPEPQVDYYEPAPIPYRAEPAAMMPAVPPAPEPPSEPITIVLKSGKTMEVQSYAIMNGMFWDFTKPNSKKIALAEIDVAASAKATDAAGGSFPEDSFGGVPQ